jgi:hypothetical protein
MSLIKALDELKKNPPIINAANTCRVAIILKSLNADERAALEKAIEDRTIAARSISNLLKENNFQIGIDSIRRHRRRIDKNADGCLCP